MKEDFVIAVLNPSELEEFYPFAQNLILKQFLDYSPKVRNAAVRDFFIKGDIEVSLRNGREVILVALRQGSLVGFLDLHFEFGGEAHVLWLGVDRKVRKLGVGTRLLSRAEKVALSKKCHFLSLDTESERNILFYKKRGFRLIGTLQRGWYGADAYLMQKSLREPFAEIFKQR